MHKHTGSPEFKVIIHGSQTGNSGLITSCPYQIYIRDLKDIFNKETNLTQKMIQNKLLKILTTAVNYKSTELNRVQCNKGYKYTNENNLIYLLEQDDDLFSIRFTTGIKYIFPQKMFLELKLYVEVNLFYFDVSLYNQ